jgi:BTB/POZ domain
MINNIDAFPDVTFLVGDNRTRFTAHRIFLITASKEFECMFEKTNEYPSYLVIEVDDIEKDAFLQVKNFRKFQL